MQRSIYDKFVAQVIARFKQLRVGSHAMDLDCGPLISADQRKRVHGFIDQAKKDGIPVSPRRNSRMAYWPADSMLRRCCSARRPAIIRWPAAKCS